jgi:hypothetical protein
LHSKDAIKFNQLLPLLSSCGWVLCREQEVDAQLRALRMSELPATLEPEQLQALLQQCRQMQATASLSAATLN